MQRAYLFLERKIQREIDWSGEDYEFTHASEDKYHKEDGKTTIYVRGVYHQTTSYKSKNTSDGSVTNTKATPMILCMFSDGSAVSVGDTVTINGKEMFVTGIENVQELNIALQISLEVNE